MKYIIQMKVLRAVLGCLGLFIVTGCFDEGNPTRPKEGHLIVYGLKLQSEEGDTLYKIYRGESNDTLQVTEGESLKKITMHFLKEDESTIDQSVYDDTHFPEWKSNGEEISVVQDSEDSWSFEVKGIKKGTSSFTFRLMHVDHHDFIAPAIPVVVK